MARRPSLDSFAVSLGLYAAVLGAAAVLAIDGEAVLPAAGLGAVAGVLVAVAAGLVDGLAATVSRRRVHYVLAAIPLLGAVVVSVGPVTGAPASLGPVSFVTMLAFFPALAVLVTADNRRVARTTAGERPTVEWTARSGKRFRRRWKRLYVALGVVLIVVPFAVGIATSYDAIGVTAVGGAVLGQTIYIGRRQAYAAYDAGLVVEPEGALRATFVPWSRFDGFRLTDDELVLARPIPGTSLHCALADLDDPDAVEAVLAERLDRLD